MITLGSILVLLGAAGLCSAVMACLIDNLIEGIMGDWYKPYAAGSMVAMSVGLLILLIGRLL